MEGIESAGVSGDLLEVLRLTKLLARNKSAPFTQPAKQADSTPLARVEKTAICEHFLKKKFRVYEGAIARKIPQTEADVPTAKGMKFTNSSQP